MAKKKLLHIQLLPLLSGVQNMMLELLSHLDSEEYEIFVLSKPGGPLVEAVQAAGYNYLPVNSLRRDFSLWDIVSFFEILHLVRQHKFDIVHTHSSKTGFIGRIASRLGGVSKVVHTVHGFAIHEHQSVLKNIIFICLERIAGWFCDKMIFVNVFERKFAENRKIIAPAKSQTIYNTVNIDKFRYAVKEYVSDRDYVETPFTIGSVLRFTTQKNTLNTIKAAVQVCHRNEHIRFIFIGDGDEFQQCRKVVAAENLNSRILLTGWQQEVEQLLPKLDAFLLYSRWEGLPISILEAMACGLPIICSDIKGNNELVTDNNGILVKIDDDDKLITELARLPQRQSDLRRWSACSRKKVEENFGIERFVKEYRDIYEL